jgi:hypothetical protein
MCSMETRGTQRGKEERQPTPDNERDNWDEKLGLLHSVTLPPPIGVKLVLQRSERNVDRFWFGDLPLRLDWPVESRKWVKSVGEGCDLTYIRPHDFHSVGGGRDGRLENRSCGRRKLRPVPCCCMRTERKLYGLGEGGEVGGEQEEAFTHFINLSCLIADSECNE